MTTCPTVKENAKRSASVIQALQVYEVVCIHCATEFGKNGHAEVMARCIGMCIDCAGYCALTRKFPERNSESAGLLLEDCAEICSQCVEECDRYGQDHCSTCTMACRACLDACLKIVGVEAIIVESTVF